MPFVSKVSIHNYLKHLLSEIMFRINRLFAIGNMSVIVKEILFHYKNIFCTTFKMVPEGKMHFLAQVAYPECKKVQILCPRAPFFKKEGKKVLFNNFVMMKFS